jgi:short-subunit dehydrogenase
MMLNSAHVVVTGASRGIGEAIADECARRGAHVTLVARNHDALAAIASRMSATAFAADLSLPGDLDGIIDRVENGVGLPVDVLVNNAGIDLTKPILRYSEQELRSIVEVNLLAPLELCRQVLPKMVARRSGHIVNISSMAGVAGFPGLVAYASTKAGLSHFSRVVRQDLKGSGVNVTAVEIGPIPTDMLDRVGDYPPTRHAFARLRRMHLLPEVPRDVVARAIADAVEKQRAHVWLPKRAGLFPFLGGLPQRFVDAVIHNIGP